MVVAGCCLGWRHACCNMMTAGKSGWWHNKTHQIDSEYASRSDGAPEWWFRGIKPRHPDLREQAYTPPARRRERTVSVVVPTHDDPVVAAVAAHQPS